ncbi:MAG TPA: dihydrolipoamide acetyltransferase family protein [Candidatus Sulfotelmatobacter sp.]|nr:dihydrolipoamide acetyltransferase family protein [Candidatus Sulfotelmatobacter sp.]
MPFDVKLPDIGEGIAEGEIVRWMVAVGEAVREDQPLVEVMTDKATVEIPSPRTGTIAALHAEAGSVVPVGSVIVSIAVAGEAAAGASAVPAAASSGVHAAAAAVATPVVGAPASAPAGRVQATPAVRQLAKQLGVALEHLAGSGPGGAITAEDVKRASGPAGTDAPRAAVSPAPGTAPAEQRVPLRGLRRRIAEHMKHSLEVTAPFTFVAECDFTALAAHRAKLKPRAEAQGIKLTYLAYVAKSLGPTLKEFPLLNASLDDERQEIVLKSQLNLGIATATEEGLMVPVLHDAGRFGLLSLAREIDRLAQSARAHHIRLEELQGGTFTVTSTGAHGGVLATPILHHPQVAILGVHEVRKRPAVVDDRIVIRDLGNLSLSLDHRVVDGAVGADFLYALIERLERPDTWLTEGELG